MVRVPTNKINFVGSSLTECTLARAFSCIKLIAGGKLFVHNFVRTYVSRSLSFVFSGSHDIRVGLGYRMHSRHCCRVVDEVAGKSGIIVARKSCRVFQRGCEGLSPLG